MSQTPTTPKYTPATPRVPFVNGFLIIMYVATILNLFYATWSVVAETSDGNYSYLVPISLYVLLFVVHGVLNYIQYRREGGWVSEILWGFDEPAWRGRTFILLGYVFIFWANLRDPYFIWLYIPWISCTLGMLGPSVGIPVMIGGGIVFVLQSNLLSSIQSNSIPIEALAGISLSALTTIGMVVMITLLIRSQIKSALLVEELQRTKAQLEEAHSKEKEVAVLRERDRMAREMHDVLGHALVLVAVKIEAAQRLQAVDPQRAAGELDATKELVRQSMADLRTSLADLRSPALEGDSKPLDRALQEWAERTAREGGFQIECNLGAEAGTLPAPVQDAFWRVGREAVLNVVKHARPKRVELHLFTKDGRVYLSVMDDGVGIPHLAEGNARLEVEGHYGVRGMRERLETLGGTLQLRPGRDGKGLLVLASVPLPPADKEPARKEGRFSLGTKLGIRSAESKRS